MSAEEAQVYVPDAEAAWARASVLRPLGGTKYEVRIDGIDDNDEHGQSDWGAGEVRQVDLAGKEFRGNTGGGSGNKSLPLQNLGTPEDGVEDMTRLDYLHEPAILFNLRKRFFRALPYTYTGDIVIACNPYRWLDLYGDERRKQYAGMLRGERARLPPHVYSTSAVAFAGLSKDRQNQSILVSGESGAGKTETVKILMGHLAVASGGGGGAPGGVNGAGKGPPPGDAVEGAGKRDDDSVIKKIIESNPLLESFGNAQTTRNDNSSRFGKFTQLQFDGNFCMSGSRCTTYLLEKSRVVGHEVGERAYHVFYQILAAPEAEKAALGLSGKQALDFRYLTADGKEAESVIEGRSDAQRYLMTTGALGLIGVSQEDTVALFRALAGVMFLGQVDFSVRGGDEDKSEVVDAASLLPPAELLGLTGGKSDGTQGEPLSSSLCYRTIKARNDVLRADSSPAQAADARDAMAKAVYGRLFDWLVSRINRSTASKSNRESSGEHEGGGGETGAGRRRAAGEPLAPGGTVALLDIFGFESFKVNRFEQLCINYANEKLQQKFTLDVFKTVQAEYEDEGIPWNHVDFSDNAEVLGLIESRMGIIAVLNEECVRPKGSDLSFVSKLATLHSDHSAFARAKLAGAHEFSVKHYAGDVLYHAEGFLDKNRDSVGEACKDLLAKSSVPLVAKVFAPEVQPATTSGGSGGARKSSKTANTLATKFRDNLTTLMDTIASTAVQYVRCIKPNAAKLPGRMENAKVAEQLRCAGVIEAIRISRAAFPNRMARIEFNRRFALLESTGGGITPSKRRKSTEGSPLVGPETEMAMCKSLLERLLPSEGQDVPLRYVMGRTRVYFRAGALESLEALRLAERSARATVVQAAARMWPRRLYYCALKAGALRGQSEWRRVAARRTFLTARARVIKTQACWRRVKAQKEVLSLRRHRAAACLQSHRRMCVARRDFLNKRAAAVAVQTFVRGAQARRSYAVMVVEHREGLKLENQILTLQRKLEEERMARQKMEEAHRQLALKAEAAAAAAAAGTALPGTVSEASVVAVPAPGGGVAGVVAEQEEIALAHGGGRALREAAAGGASSSSVTASAAGLLEGAITFFSPKSLAKAKKLMDEEDERRVASGDIIGESSEMIAALKAERDKLRKDNLNLKNANESLRRERQQEKQKALNNHEASGMSYHALNQTLKGLAAKNHKLNAELKQLQAVTNEDRTAMMEMVQTKAEDLLRREEEGRTMRVLYESEVTKGKNKLRMMETMIRLVAEASPPIDALDKDELVLHMSAMYKDCMQDDPNVVGEVDRMSMGGMGQLSDKATSVLTSAKGMMSSFFGGGRPRTNIMI